MKTTALMIDQDILDAYRAKAQKTGDKYQSLIDRTLREALDTPELEKRITDLENQIRQLVDEKMNVGEL